MSVEVATDVATGEQSFKAAQDKSFVPVKADAAVEKDPAETMRQLLAQMQPEPVKAPEPVKVEPVAAPEATKQPTPQVNPDLEKARKALERDGLPKSLVDTWTPEQIVEIGSKRAKVQSDSDNVYRELSELKKSKETPKQEPDPNISAGNPDFDKAIEPIAKLLGTEEAVALRQLIETQSKQAYERAIQEFDRREQAMRQVAEAKQSLVSKHSWLTDEDFKTVFEHSQTRDATKFESLEALFEDSLQAKFAPKLVEMAVAKAVEAASKERERDLGQPLKGTVNRDVRALPEEERAAEGMRLLSTGMPWEEVRKRLGR